MMSTRPRPQPSLAALCLALAFTGAARAEDGDVPGWSFSGFGTLAAVYSSQREADFVGTIQQPNGAGRSQVVSFAPDSKLGGQLTARFTPEWSAVVQAVAQHQYDDTWTPQIEWANVQYAASPALRVRVGRVALPSFMISETRFVGYANTSVRPPQEVYLLNPNTSNDGFDATYVSHVGDAVNSLSALLGTGSTTIAPGVEFKSKFTWGVNDTLEWGPTTLRIGYVQNRLKVQFPGQQFIDGLNAFGAATAAIPVPGIQAAGAQATALARKYDPRNITLAQIFSIGALHDTGTWFVAGEFARFVSNSPVVPNASAGYVTGGYRIGAWTPYATLAAVTTPVNHDEPIPTVGLPPALAGAATALNIGTRYRGEGVPDVRQKSVTLGLRWDFMRNVAAKLQYDHVRMGASSSGRLVNPSANFETGGSLNLVTVDIDFVF